MTTGVIDAVTIVHGPRGCAHHNFSLFLSHSRSVNNQHYPVILSSDLEEKDIIFGGEGALRKTIFQALSIKPSIVFVLSTCLIGITGDDVETICAVPSNVKIVYIPGEGFFGGGFHDGFVTALRQLSDIGNSCGKSIKSVVNIIGERNLESSADFQFAEINRLLNSLGLKIGIRFIRNFDIASINLIKSSQLNILRDPLLKKFGDYLKDKYGTPYYSSFPEGFMETRKFITEISGILDINPTASLNNEVRLQEEIKKEFSDLYNLTISGKDLNQEFLTSSLMNELYNDFHIQIRDDGIPFKFANTPPVGSNGVRYLLRKIRKARNADL